MTDTPMTADEALTQADPFTVFGFAPDRYAEILFYRCRECGARGPVGRASLDGDFRDLPEPEQAAHTWPTDHCNAEGHEHSDRITLSRAPGRTTTVRRMSKATRPALIT
ncbi:hypothetical protein OG883_45555 [Streptomyces sp. NBC_01142]|uniref:hypothetical protein n=1 Tax=Streptomyces sp. NBC_01142 TaxID=2975865 RepID=UPI0022530785|nr:hypothetical protein [Streptomyces sp. NBC_01142]MCX4826907.1 hypothetical protein [Streptomyces sp. NBC_01142]